jgi:PhzF family phenazine biosynthesis protein
MKCPIFQIDAFTTRPFGGNPAAVVILDEWPADEILQSVAAENNLSETAFAVADGGTYGLRWFTPTMEVDLCGHATLATAFVLFNEGLASGEEIRFQTKECGELLVTRGNGLLNMDFPARPPEPIVRPPELSDVLGARPKEVHAARDLVALFETEEDVAGLMPHFERFAALDAFAVIATAPGRDADFVSRFFAPAAGIPEDPVTGSAHCTLIPFWSRRLGKRTMRALQISARVGEVFCEDRDERVIISGRAVEYLRGEITI